MLVLFLDWFDSSMNSINANDEDTVFNVGAGTYFVKLQMIMVVPLMLLPS